MRVERTFVARDSATGRREGAGGQPCQGLWYTPAGASPRVGVIATHYDVDFSQHYLAEPLARRGFGFLGWNTRFRGNGAWFFLDHALADLAEGVRWLREEAGVEAVVLLGNSGGASLMAAYQSRAPDADAGPTLPAADAFVSLNAHPGRPEVLTAWMDPSMTDEADPLSRDPSLDMFDGANGPPYPPDFVARYRATQRERNDRITAWALGELGRLAAAGVPDRMFAVHRVWADLRFLDLSLDPSDREPGCYAGDARRANYGPFGLARACTLRTWLDMWSLQRSPCRAAPHLARIGRPALVVQSTADQGCFPSDARAIFDALGSADKRLEFLPGDHYFQSPDGAREAVADLAAEWLKEKL